MSRSTCQGPWCACGFGATPGLGFASNDRDIRISGDRIDPARIRFSRLDRRDADEDQARIGLGSLNFLHQGKHLLVTALYVADCISAHKKRKWYYDWYLKSAIVTIHYTNLHDRLM